MSFVIWSDSSNGNSNHATKEQPRSKQDVKAEVLPD